MNGSRSPGGSASTNPWPAGWSRGDSSPVRLVWLTIVPWTISEAATPGTRSDKVSLRVFLVPGHQTGQGLGLVGPEEVGPGVVQIEEAPGVVQQHDAVLGRLPADREEPLPQVLRQFGDVLGVARVPEGGVRPEDPLRSLGHGEL